MALATLTVAGMLKVNFRRYLLLISLGINLGYFSDVSRLLFRRYLLENQWADEYRFVGALLVAVVLALRSINKYLLKKEI